MSQGRRGAAVLAVLVVLGALALGGCTTAPPPPPAPAPPPAPDEPTELVVGIDELGEGFNPHLLAHVSTATTALSTLVLPSVFRPGPDGALQLDRAVATSAQVVSRDPFTVSYEINVKASWSNSAPIAAEDFVYLWDRMRSEPGVTDGAGYQLITAVRSRAGGKAVDVVFAEPYPAWQTLFANLLPAHLLKDAPGSWTGALTGGIPVSGGPFRVDSVDRNRGQIVLARNDAYWDSQAVLDKFVLRRVDPAGMAAGMRNGELPIVLPTADAAAVAALGGLGPVAKLTTVPQPVVVQLGLRGDAGPLADFRTRRAVAALLDRTALIAAGTGGPPAQPLPAEALLTAPSQPGYARTGPEGPPLRPDPAQAAALLTEVGYVRLADGRWTGPAGPLRLTVGAPVGRESYLRVATATAAQLTAAGIPTEVVTAPGTALYSAPNVDPVAPTSTTPSSGGTSTSATPSPAAASQATPSRPSGGAVRVDVLVMPRTVGGDPGTELMSDYGCPASTQAVPDPPPGPSGYCNAALRPLMLAAITGEQLPTAEALATAEGILWTETPVIPLYQPTSLLAVTPAAEAATGIGPGPLLTGPLSGAQRWPPAGG